MANRLTVPPERVVAELCAEPLGRALWERAHFAVLATLQADRIAELENEKAPTVPTEPRGQGWEVPSE